MAPTAWAACKTKNGEIFEVAQWYPRMAVYDDVEGWNTLPYMSAEFYLDYGNFDYTLNVPANYLVGGSGELVNPGEVLTSTQQSRLAQRRRLGPDGAGALGRGGDAGRLAAQRQKRPSHLALPLPAGARRGLGGLGGFCVGCGQDEPAQRPQVAGPGRSTPWRRRRTPAWNRSTEAREKKHRIQLAAVVRIHLPGGDERGRHRGRHGVSGHRVLRCAVCKGRLWGVTDHEFGHNWFPMIVGLNERKYPWMDEGFNTFINILSTNAFNNGEYKALNDTTRLVAAWRCAAFWTPPPTRPTPCPT